MAKFTTGSIITIKEQDKFYSTRIQAGNTIEIEGVIENDWTKTSFYLINNQRWPVPYVEKHYKMMLGSLLKQL